jgi:hypothetical protein
MDSTLVEPLVRVLVVFGIPVGWLAAGGVTVVGVVNTIKALLPKTLASTWYPIIGLLVSGAYAGITLWPNYTGVAGGTFALWFLTWATWVGLKMGATAIGARTK